MPNVTGIGGEALRQYIERIERLTEEKKDLAADIKDVFAEAKSTGFDVKIIRAIIKRRACDANELQEYEAMLALYETALHNGTPIEAHINKKTNPAATAPIN